MDGFTVKAIDEMEAINDGLTKLAGAELGVESFGMQVFDFSPGFPDYPEHDHSHDGQEEVYVVLRGSAEFELDGERVPVRWRPDSPGWRRDQAKAPPGSRRGTRSRDRLHAGRSLRAARQLPVDRAVGQQGPAAVGGPALLARGGVRGDQPRARRQRDTSRLTGGSPHCRTHLIPKNSLNDSPQLVVDPAGGSAAPGSVAPARVRELDVGEPHPISMPVPLGANDATLAPA